jgi:lipopolysaccharide exporter
MTAQEGSTLSNTKWTILSSVINGIITIAIGAVLARLLNPDVFGLTAIGFLVIAFAGYFVKLWVGPALIQKEQLSNGEISFAISFSMVIGFIATIVIFLFSSLIASIFNKPESTQVIEALSLLLWITSFSAPVIGLLRRNMRFKTLSIVSIAQTVLTGILSIIMAVLGLGVWSLIWPLIISQLLGLLVLFLLLRQSYPIKLSFSFSGHGYLLKFGSKYTLISILEYFGSNLDTIFMGRLFSLSQLGVYNRAYKLAYLPSENLIASITSVMFPVFSRLQNQKEEFVKTQNRLFVFVGLLSTCIAMGMVPAGKDIVLVLLGPQWISSIPILVVILFAVPFDFMSVTLGLSFDATGNLNEKIKIQITSLITLLIGIIFLYPYGPIGIATALVIAHLIRFIYYLLSNKIIFSISYKRVLRNIVSIFLAGAITFSACLFVVNKSIAWAMPPFQSLLFEIIVCSWVFIFLLFINSPSLLGVKNYTQSIDKIRTFLTSKRGKNHE